MNFKVWQKVALSGLAPAICLLCGSVPAWSATPSAAERLMATAQTTEQTDAVAEFQKLSPDRQAQVVQDLIAALKNDQRIRAAAALGAIGPQASAAAAALKSLVVGSSLEVRTAAFDALQNIGTPEALLVIRAQLKNPDPAIRRSAVDALTVPSWKSEELMREMLKMLSDPDPRIREQATGALAGGKERFGRDPGYVDAVVARLNDSDEAVRIRAMQVLPSIPAKAAPAITQSLKGRLPALRQVALMSLSRIDPPVSLPINEITALLRDPDVETRMLVPNVILQLKPRLDKKEVQTCVVALAKAASDSDWRVQLPALNVLRSFGPAASKAVPAIKQQLKDSEAVVRDAASLALTAIENRAPASSPPPSGMRLISPGISGEHFPNGKLKTSMITAGSAKGSRQDFFDTGLKKSEQVIDNGVLIVSREWYPDQTPKNVTYFKGGKPFLTKDWGPDGSLVVRRGVDFHELPLPENVHQFIAKSFPDSKKRRMALNQFAQAKEMAIAESSDRAKSLTNLLMVSAGQECVFHVVGFPAAMQVIKDLDAAIQNTEARLRASLGANTHFGGQTYQLATAKEKKSRCDFDPDKLPN